MDLVDSVVSSVERVSIVYPKLVVISSRNIFLVFMISGRFFAHMAGTDH